MNQVLLLIDTPRNKIECRCADHSEAMTEKIKLEHNGVKVVSYEIRPADDTRNFNPDLTPGNQ